MASVLTRQPTHSNGTDPGDVHRRIAGPGRRLPGGRAIVGGLLVTSAMVGAVALSRSAAAPDTAPVLIASEPIAPFETLGPHNLHVADLALPDDVLSSTYADPEALAGTVSRSHIASGELLHQGDVVESTEAQRSAAPSREISLRIDAERAVDGRLEAGDRVDVLATYGNGVDALTFLVLADAPVLSVARVEGGVTSSRTIVLTLALEDRSDTITLAHAVDNADVTVVRTTTSDSDDSNPTSPFRPIEAEVD